MTGSAMIANGGRLTPEPTAAVAQPEQDPDGVQLPRVVDEPVVAPLEDAVHHPALREQLVELLRGVLPSLHVLPGAQDAHQDDEVEGGDDVEEDAGDACTDDAADAGELATLLQQQPGRVVDRGDVVGVERVPEAEHVGK